MTILTIDNSRDTLIQNPLGQSNLAPTIVFTEGNRETTQILSYDTMGRLIIPEGLFNSKTVYKTKIVAGADIAYIDFDVIAVKNPYGNSNQTSGGCNSGCNPCGQKKCECKQIDITPFVEELKNVRCELNSVYETYREIRTLPEIVATNGADITKVITKIEDLGYDYKNLDKLINAISIRLDGLDKEFKNYEDGFRKHLRDFSDLSYEVSKIKQEILDLNDIRNNIKKLLTLDEDFKKLVERLVVIEDLLKKYDFNLMEVNSDEIAKLDKYVKQFNLGDIQGNYDSIVKIEALLKGKNLSQIETNRLEIEQLKLNHGRTYKDIESRIVDIPTVLKDVSKLQTEIVKVSAIEPVQNKTEELCAEITRLSQFQSDVNDLNTKRLNELANTINLMSKSVTNATVTSDNAYAIAKGLEEKINSVAKDVETNKDHIQINHDNIDLLFEQNKAIVDNINKTNQRVDNILKDINEINRKINKILGSTNSCPDRNPSGTVGSPCN